MNKQHSSSQHPAIHHAQPMHRPRREHEPTKAEIFPLHGGHMEMADTRPPVSSILSLPAQTFGWMMTPLMSWIGGMHTVHSEPMPKIESAETKKAYFYKADLPGITADQVSLNIRNGMLLMRIAVLEDIKEHGYHHLSSRTVRRALTLPVYIDGSAITAELKDGQLFITIPKSRRPVAPPKTPISIT